MPQQEKEDSGLESRGGFLSDEDLQELVENGGVAIPIENSNSEEQYKPKKLESERDEEWSDWTVDLCLGNEVFLSSKDEIRELDQEESISIDPGEFALLITEEIVDIPQDKTGLISLKFRHARKGLINISGFHVDPNYKGRIVFSVYNASPSPVILRRGDPVFMIVFSTLTKSVEGNRSSAAFQNIGGIETDWVESLQGRTTSLENLDERVSDIESESQLNRRILIGIALAIITAIISFGTSLAVKMISF